MSHLTSWGRYPYHPQTPHSIYWPDEAINLLGNISSNYGIDTTLPYGSGRSYGDSCFAQSGHVLLTENMDRVLSVDWNEGVIRVQAGLTLEKLIEYVLPHGWFLPVTPGTKYVTIGGAIANDVHGKNHHIKGTFGCHVNQVNLYRSADGVVDCSRSNNSELFSATVGGLGLTGLILDAEIQLRRVQSNQIDQVSIKFDSLNDFFDISKSEDINHEYAVAWIDCLAKEKSLGRGRYFFGDHSLKGPLKVNATKKLNLHVAPPFSLISPITLKVFNTFFYHRQLNKITKGPVNYDSFFYPLDSINNWNKIYGRKGFQQYQCVIPNSCGREVVKDLMKQISQSGGGSFLAVLKQCGVNNSPGVLSFPMEGVSLALDFPQRELFNQKLFLKLDALVHEAGGRLYPAKDAHMTAKHFKQAYPRWSLVEKMRDPKLLSMFWNRVALA